MYIGYPRAEAMNENGGLLASAIPQPDPIFTMTTGRRVVGTTFVTITGHRPAYFCALLSASNDNLSMNPGLLNDNLVIEPRNHLQSCH